MPGKKKEFRLTDIQKQDIIDAYEQRNRIAEIAEQFNVSEATVWYTVSKAGKIIKPKRVSSEDKQSISNAYQQGCSTSDLSERFGLCQVTIQKIVKSVHGSLRKRFTTEEERNLIIVAYRLGKSSYQIAEDFGISRPSVCDIIKKAGIKIRGFSKLTKQERGEVRTAYLSGVLTSELSKRYGIAPESIRAILKRFGIDTGWGSNEAQKLAIKNAYKAKGVRYRGEKASQWKGGKTSLSLKIRTSARYSQWRKSVFKRDKFTCQHCCLTTSESRIKIEADHIYPFGRILQDYKIKTIEDADQCSALWDTDNGRTLCVDCHKKTDTYGRKVVTAAI
ncbi:hypothetical protein [Spirosoma oryzicola]|uniref:hypothetical protein n=1 Tax=Spirosoma oryzicola TaxID=2898794 RepID=UPI001E5C77AB|nr:hypothetical protein [Spirosoma oryzicola]UHG93268.1 hypothetical protein LQ777_10285 [Spirosoma oryzicola]